MTTENWIAVVLLLIAGAVWMFAGFFALAQ